MEDDDISFGDRLRLIENASMVKWWEAVNDLEIPMPKTIIIDFNEDQQTEIIMLCRGKILSNETEELLKENAKKIGYPLFMRTDQTSCKHEWQNTCYVESEGELINRLYHLIEESSMLDMLGLPVDAIVFREYIEMATGFKAFDGMPVNPERRFFAEDGKIVSDHAYWVEPAIRFRTGTDEPNDWKERLAEMNANLEGEELERISNQVRIISKALTKELGGEWSIDFCKGKDGIWYFIDTAPSEVSYHPPEDEELQRLIEERDEEIKAMNEMFEEMKRGSD